MSSEPPPVGCAPCPSSPPSACTARGGRSSGILVASPRTGCFSSRWNALASVWSSSDHVRQTDLFDIRLHRFGDRLVEISRPRAAKEAFAVFGIGHQSGSFRHVVADAPQVHDVVIIGFAEIEPDSCVGRNHVRLIAAVGDHVMHARGQTQMLAAELVADAHQLHCVERAAAAPRGSGGVRAFALEIVLDRDQAVRAAGSVGDCHVIRHVREEHDVDVLEHSRRERSRPWCPAVPRRRRATGGWCPADARAPSLF